MAEMNRRPHTSVYGNLAYDLDAIVRERQLEEAGAMPERRQQPRQEIRTRTRTNAQAKARPSHLLLGGAALLCAMVVVLMLGFAQLTRVSASVSSIKSQITDLEEEHVSLLTRYEKTFDLATIKEVAENAGMSKPTSGQIEYIDLSGGDTAVVYRSEGGNALHGVLSQVEAGVSSVWEFFQ